MVVGHRLAKTARPVVEKLADEIREHVVLAVFFRGERHTICVVSRNPEIHVRTDRGPLNDVYQTVTGRLLLAHAPEEVIEAYADRNGFPGARWDNVSSMKALRARLASLRKAGFASDETGKVLATVARPIRGNSGDVVAALGIAAPRSTFGGAHRKRCLAGLRGAVEEIEGLLRGTAE